MQAENFSVGFQQYHFLNLFCNNILVIYNYKDELFMFL